LVESEASAAVAGYDGRYSPRVRLTIEVAPGLVFARCERRLSSLDVPGGPVLGLVTVDTIPMPAPGPAKPLDRSPWDDALRRARAGGGDQAVLVALDGHVIDGSTASLWVVKDGALYTTPSPPAIPGVARAWLLGRADSLGLNARVSDLTPGDLRLADELFLTNALAGAVAVRGKSGPITSTVMAAFARMWEGSSPTT
jgi:branched-subunit amino acid aminotransferase/4-amino-4-deoxychorismate lyase